MKQNIKQIGNTIRQTNETKRWVTLLFVSLLSCEMNSALSGQNDTITMQQCISIAMEHQPQLASAKGALMNAQAGLTQTASIFYPQLSATAGLTRYGGTQLNSPIPLTAMYDIYQTGIGGQMMLLDFGKSIYKTLSSSYSVDAASQDYSAIEQNVIFNTVQAYFNYQEAEKVVGATEESLRSFNEHLDQTKAFFSVGQRAQFDVTKAEVDVANAEVSLLKAKNTVRIARVQLENAMGAQITARFFSDDSIAVPFSMWNIDSALSIAKTTRPEVVAAEFRLHAGETFVTSTWLSRMPTVSLTGGYNWKGLDVPLVSSWNAGVTVSLPLFFGFSIDASVDQARAGVMSASAAYDGVVQSVRLEIQQNIFLFDEAHERIIAARKLVEEALESHRLAVARYASGVGSAIEVTDANVTLLNARITEIQAVYDYRSAYVGLKRSIGILKMEELHP